MRWGEACVQSPIGYAQSLFSDGGAFIVSIDGRFTTADANGKWQRPMKMHQSGDIRAPWFKDNFQPLGEDWEPILKGLKC